MRDFLHRWFVENAALKAVSFILAITLFIVVRGEKDVQVGAAMRVVYTTADDKVLVSEPVDQVRMIVRGAWSRLRRFDERDLDPVHIDLRQVKGGIFRFDSDMVHGLPPGVEVVSFSPPSIELRFEELGLATVPVTAVPEGEVPYGYEVTHLTPDPPVVTVRGPKSQLATVKSLSTRPITVAGVTAPFTVDVPLAALPRNFEVINQRLVHVRVQIGPHADVVTREHVKVAVTGLTLLDGQVTPAEVTVVLRGPQLSLDAVNYDELAAIVEATREDDEREGDHKKRVNVTGLPTNVAFEVKPTEVTLKTKKRSFFTP